MGFLFEREKKRDEKAIPGREKVFPFYRKETMDGETITSCPFWDSIDWSYGM
jgi:hypothetical protein